VAEAIFEDMHRQRVDAVANDSEATMRAMGAGIHTIGAASGESADIGH
jgi:hypothetical protein